jgi:PAS domain S-box-containing protein
MPGETESVLPTAATPGGIGYSLLDAAADGIIVIRRAGRIVYANREAERIFGRARGTLEGAELLSLLTDPTRAACARWLAAPGPNEGAFRAGFGGTSALGLRGDGSELRLEIAIGKPSSSTDVPLLMASVRESSAPISSPPASLNQERRASTWLEAILEFAPAFIIAVNPGGNIEYINRVLPQYSKKDVIGSFWLQYFPPDLWPTMQAALGTVLATGNGGTYEVSTAGPDGRTIYFSSQIGAIRNGDQIVGAVLVSQDITEAKRTQTELLSARRMALLGTVAAGVAHEINTPIQYVGDSIHFLRDATQDILNLFESLHALRRAALDGTPVSEAIAAAFAAERDADFPYLRENIPLAFARCVEGLDRVATIVRSLKEFAHPAEKEMVAIDINHAIQSSLTIAANEYKYVATLETDFDEVPPVTCHGGEVSQTVLNIIVNAAHAIEDVVKGTNNRGVIGVRTKREGDSVLISISDTGTGIREADRARVFDPFYTTKDVGKGTGQGLSMAWATIVDKHGGELYFDTEVGKGTTFFIRLAIDGKPLPPRGAKAAG